MLRWLLLGMVSFCFLVGIPKLGEAASAELVGKTVVLDPGHGGCDPGAVNMGMGIYEKHINMAVARRLQSRLQAMGARVLLTHNDPDRPERAGEKWELPYISLNQRVQLANREGADLFLSLHVNSFSDPNRAGKECFYARTSEEGRRLAECLRRELATLGGETACHPSSLYVLQHTRMPAVVVEMGYLSNTNEAARLLDPEYQQRLAEALSAGIKRYFDRYGSHPAAGNLAHPRPRVAIVIDDFAGPSEKQGTREFMTLRCPLTFAVLPNYPLSAPTAREAVKAGFEVLVHLPMEPVKGSPSWLGPGAIYVHLSDKEIERRVEKAIASVPGAVGINNHTGSRATADPRVMRAVLRVVQSHQLFFLDSKTTNKSVIPQIAEELGVPYAEDGLFLDAVNDAAHIKKQLYKLARIALKQGSAIAIGHVGVTGPNTVQAIKEMLPEFERMGIELVYVSALVKQPSSAK
ncbi:divergent polysaccharide deacetylase family protein [Desulfothermobacter acidiphilus]|uniref:divergent polysaccharide deacetylase family protein n=1 Tax=Desulfothermobacter acidiphilus TaxID=1938353 RepID=UPI003F896DEE